MFKVSIVARSFTVVKHILHNMLIQARPGNILIKTSPGYRFLLKRDYSVRGPTGYPVAPWINAVLKSQEDVDRAIEQVQALGLPLMSDLPKNWDSLAALDFILKNTNKRAKIFDAGAELYSVILPWLFLYGYKNLIGGNLVFDKKIRRGPILYEYSDITRTKFKPSTLDVVVCLSVIEHGVDLSLYFKEMSRILKPNGMLITSTDYYETPIDTKGQRAYGVPIHIFTKEEITHALCLAQEFNFVPTGPLDLASQEKVVYWKQYDLRYSFLIFTLRKTS